MNDLLKFINQSKNHEGTESMIITETRQNKKIDFFEGLLNSTSDIILAIDRNYKIIAINNAAQMATQLNWGKVSEVGTSIIDILPEKDRERSQLLYESIFRGEPAEREHLEMISPKGGIQHYEMTYYLITDPSGEGVGIAMFIRDVTDLYETQLQLKEKQAQLEQFMNAIPVGVFVINKNGVPHFANETAKEMLGKGIMPAKGAEELGEVYQAYKYGSDALYPMSDMPIVKALSGQVAQVDDMEIRNGEKRLQLEVRATPVFNQQRELEYAIAVFQDISERKTRETVSARQQAIQKEISTKEDLYNGNFDQAIEFLTEKLCEAVDVKQAGVWFIDPMKEKISAVDVYQKLHMKHLKGIEIFKKDFPNYFKELQEEKIIVANNALSHHATAEFSETYLKPNGIGAMLDVLIRSNGKMIGVICLEHIGNERQWSTDEINFANYISQMVSLALQSRDRKHAEQVMLENAMRLQEAQRVATIGDFDFNLATGELKWSDVEYTVFGVDKSVTPSFDVFAAAIHVEDRARVIQEFQTALGDPTVSRIRLDFRVVYAGGEVRYTNGEVVIVRNELGAPIRAYGTNQDITEQKLSEYALRKSEENFRNTTATVPGMLYQFMILPDGTISMPFVSEGCRDIYGLEPSAIMENPMVLFGMMEPEDIAASQVAIAESAANMTPFIYETRYSLPNGKKIWTRYQGKPTKRDDGIIVWYGVNVDITELKALEAELSARLNQIQETQNHLIQSEKMSALGQMVAGIAHELNTPIGYASNNVSIIRERFNAMTALLKKSIEAQDYVYQGSLESAFEKMQEVSNSPNGTLGELEETLRRTDRLFTGVSTGFEQMTNLVRSMRNFSRLDEADMKKADLNEGVKGCLLMVGHLLKDKDVELTTEYGTIPLVDCYPAQLNQVFLNLVGNAIHAVEENPNGKVHVQTKYEGNEVVVRVIDNGKGIPKHAQKKIFDPFFTTKPVGKGTGLGLSISYDIVKKHNGELSFETQEGVGTTFTVKIPAVEFMADAN